MCIFTPPASALRLAASASGSPAQRIGDAATGDEPEDERQGGKREEAPAQHALCVADAGAQRQPPRRVTRHLPFARVAARAILRR